MTLGPIKRKLFGEPVKPVSQDPVPREPATRPLNPMRDYATSELQHPDEMTADFVLRMDEEGYHETSPGLWQVFPIGDADADAYIVQALARYAPDLPPQNVSWNPVRILSAAVPAFANLGRSIAPGQVHTIEGNDVLRLMGISGERHDRRT
jgi:hypothetical protein